MKLIRLNHDATIIDVDDIANICPNNNLITVQLKNNDTITGHFLLND